MQVKQRCIASWIREIKSEGQTLTKVFQVETSTRKAAKRLVRDMRRNKKNRTFQIYKID